MSKPINTVYKDPCFQPSSGKSDFTFEGPASNAAPEFNINGAKVVTIVGDGYLDDCLKELDKS
jgi:hypothetical protein